MGILEDLGVDAVGMVNLPQAGWHAAARKMIEARRMQVTNAFRRAKSEWQEEVLAAELKRLAELENYVHVCESLHDELWMIREREALNDCTEPLSQQHKS